MLLIAPFAFAQDMSGMNKVIVGTTTTPVNTLEIISSSGSDIGVIKLGNSSTEGYGPILQFYSGVNASNTAAIRSRPTGTGGTAAGNMHFQTKGPGVGLLDRMIISHEGNVGIATTTPQTTLHNSGFTMLGDNSPKFKLRLLTTPTNTAAAENGQVTFAHGVADASKILEIVVRVFVSPNYFPPEDTYDAGYQYSARWDATNVSVNNHPTSSENILTKPIVCYVVYTE